MNMLYFNYMFSPALTEWPRGMFISTWHELDEISLSSASIQLLRGFHVYRRHILRHVCERKRNVETDVLLSQSETLELTIIDNGIPAL